MVTQHLQPISDPFSFLGLKKLKETSSWNRPTSAYINDHAKDQLQSEHKIYTNLEYFCSKKI
jgi:hypothetical protein